MITVEINIKDSAGSQVSVNKTYEGLLLGKNLDEIETLVCAIKKDSMAESEQTTLKPIQNRAKPCKTRL